MIKINNSEVKSIFYNGSEVVKAYYNNALVYEKIKSAFVRGIVADGTDSISVQINGVANEISTPGGVFSIEMTQYYPLTNLNSMFWRNTSMNEVTFESVDTSKVTDMSNMFGFCPTLNTINGISNFDTHNVTDMNSMFGDNYGSLIYIGDLSNWDTSKVTNMSQMFLHSSNLESVGNLSNWNVGNVTDMNAMFYGCYNLASVGDLSNWNVGNVTDMTNIFHGCSAIPFLGDLSNWNVGNVTSFSEMFYSCSNLASVGDLSNWNVGNATDMSRMFFSCSNLESVGDLSNWDTSKVTNMNGMFSSSNIASLGIPQIGNGENEVDTFYMFGYCNNLFNITASGPIYNSVSFEQSPLTKDSVRVILEALQAPYSGTQTLTFSNTTKNWIDQDETFYDLVAEKVALGWTINLNPPISMIITGTVTDTSKLPSVIFNNRQSDSTSITPTLPQKIVSTLEGNDWSVKVNGFNYAAFMFFGGHSVDTNDNAYVDTISIPEKMRYLNPSTMHAMFFAGNIQNDNLRQINGLENIDTSNSTTMYRLFCNRENLNGISEGIANWDTSKVTNMQYAFYNCKSLESLDLSNWDTHNVTTMSYMFQNCSALTTVGDLSNWDTSKVTDMSAMFQSCSNLTTISLPQIGTQTRYVNSRTMFEYCTSLTTITASGPIYNSLSFINSPLTKDSVRVVLEALQVPYSGTQTLTFSTTTKELIDQDETFYELVVEKKALGWDINLNPHAKVLAITGTVTDTSKTPKIRINCTDTSSSSPTSGTLETTTLEGNNWGYSFDGETKFDGLAFMLYDSSNSNIDTISFPVGIDTSNVVSARSMFRYRTNLINIEGLQNLDTSNVIDMSNMFYNCNNLSLVELSNWNVGNVIDMSNMFYGCNNLSYMDLSNWNTGNVINMSNMFYDCNNLSLVELSNWNVDNVSNFTSMFYNCSSLLAVDLSNWNVAAATEMSFMFYNCNNLFDVGDVSNWNVGNVSNFTSMFKNCSSLYSLWLLNWNVGNATTFSEMFSGCTNLFDLSSIYNWNTAKLKSAYYMFYKCSSLEFLDLSGWDTSKVTDWRSTFEGCSSLTSLGLPEIVGVPSFSVSSMFRGCTSLTDIPAAGPIYSTLSFSDSPLTIESAKVILNALQEPYNGAQTLRLSSSTMVLILADPEAQQLAQEKSALGWTITA